MLLVCVRKRSAAGRPEAVLHVGRRMVRREAELAEVVLLELDLGSVVHGEAEAHEHVDDLVADARDGVRVPERSRRAAGQGEVEGGRVEVGLALGAREGLQARRRTRASTSCLTVLTELADRLARLGRHGRPSA